MKDKMTANKKSLRSNIRPGNLIRVCVGVLVFGLYMAASTNLSAQAKSKEQAMAEQFRGKVLRVQAKHSGMYLNVAGANQANLGGIDQTINDPGKSQRWLIEPVPDGGGKVYFIAMHSGLLLDVHIQDSRNASNWVAQWEYLNPKVWTEPRAQSQMWWLEEATGGHWKIRNDKTDRYLDVIGANKAQGAWVGEGPENDGDQQIWKIEPVDNLKIPNFTPGSFSSVPPALTGLGTPGNGELVEVERVLVPFYFVTDDSLGRSEKMKRSPYYILSISKQWVPEEVLQNTGRETTMPFAVIETRRIETSIKTEIEKSISATVTAKGSYGLGEVSASVTGSLTEKTATGQVVEKAGSKSYTETIDKETIVVLWNDLHTYKLMRLDGTEIKSWTKNGKFIVKNKFTSK